MFTTHNISRMNTTRNTIIKARAIAILSACAVYLNTTLFFNLLVLTGSHRGLVALLSAAGAMWLWDTYKSRGDYSIRMVVLGAGYGVAAAGTATLFS